MYLLFFCLVFSSSYAYCIEKTEALYKVTRIKSKGDYYIIHAQRNDSLFKIISKKVLMNNKPNLDLLKKREYYYFDFRNNNEPTENKIEPLSGISNYLDVKNKNVFVDGNTRIRFTKRFHYRLYTTKNLIGLYYVPKPPVD